MSSSFNLLYVILLSLLTLCVQADSDHVCSSVDSTCCLLIFLNLISQDNVPSLTGIAADTCFVNYLWENTESEHPV